MARKFSKGKRPTETMRQRQQRLLREQRARKAAKTKPVKASSSTPSSTRVEKVKVKVEGQRQLPPGKPPKGALPSGQRGGAVSTGNRPRRRNVNTNPPSNTTRTATGSRPAPKTKPAKPSLGNRAYVRARQLGVNPTVATDAITKGAKINRLGGAATAAALIEAGLAATPGPTGRRVRANQAERDRKRNSVMDMAQAKGRQVLEGLGLVDKPRKTKPSSNTSSSSNTKPPKTRTNNAAAINARLEKQRKEKAAALAQTGNGKSKPKPNPKPAPTPQRTPARSGAASTRSGAASSPSKAPQSKNMDANYRAWADANPSLAKKVKKGQSGYNAINNKPTKTPSVPANRGAGNGAPGAQPRRTEPAAPKKAKTALETAAEKRKKKKSAANRAGWQGNRNY